MLIVLECPGCAKRYEVDAGLAGKKSRCKQCGEVFRIPVPPAISAAPPPSKPSRPANNSSGGEEWQSVLVERQPAVQPSFDPAAATSGSDSTARPGAKIVLNCPRCQKRYEVDCALAGKKSRCKGCGEVFPIPVPKGRGGSAAAASSGRGPAISSPAYWEPILEEVEPAALKASRGSARPAYDEVDLPPPPRAAYPQPERKSYLRRDSRNNPDIGFTLAGLFAALAIIVVMGFYIWMVATEPDLTRTAAALAITSMCMHATALVLSFAGNIWMLVLAFKEKLEQGLLCLLVPCYAFYYVFTRWEDTKGAFILMLLPIGNGLLFFAVLLGLGISAARERAEEVRQAHELRGADATAQPPSAGPAHKANRDHVRRLEEVYKAQKEQYGRQAVTVVFRGLPTNSDPTAGVTTRDVSEALNKRTRELAPSATHVMSIAVDNESALVLAPVDNITALASRIDFGTAVVKGDRIEVQVSQDYIASVPRLPAQAVAGSPGRRSQPEFPPGADGVTRSLIQLQSPELQTKKEGVQRLQRTPPDQRAAAVVAALVPLLNDDDGFLVCDVIRVLAVWKSPDAVPALIERTSDNRFNVRHEAIQALGTLKDPRGIDAIVARLKEDGHQAVEALRAIGSAAEPALIERLTNPDADVRKRACEVLKEIGGPETLKAMQSLPVDPDFFVRTAAQDAVKNIVARVGPLPASERKGRGSASQRRPKR